MNIVRIPRLLMQSAQLLTVLGSTLLITACGGGGDSKSSSSSSVSSSSSSHVFSSTPTTTPGSGTWPDVKVSASGTKSLKFDWSAVSGTTHYKLMKKANSSADYVQVGSNFTSNSAVDPVSVHLTDWVNTRYKIQACNDSGCQDSNPIVADSAMNAAITYLKASNTEANDWFGWSVTIAGDGKTMAIGAPAEASNATGVNGDQTSNLSPTSGAIYVFTKVNGNWTQEAYLKASNTEQPSDGVTGRVPNPNSRFGYQVALSTDGNTLAVSAINEDSVSIGVNCEPHNLTYSSSTANSSISQGYVTKSANTDIGAVYVFKRIGTQWSQQAYIKPLLAYDYSNIEIAFGYSLALSGDGKTLAVGTSVDGIYGSGIVSTNVASSDSSTSFKCLDFSSSSSSSTSSSTTTSSSSSTSSSSNSSSSSSIAGGPNSGAVYIYTLRESGWIEQAFVKASDAEKADYFGASLALSYSGDALVVGAPGEDSKDASANNDTIIIQDVTYALDNGGVYVFERSGNVWTQSTKLKPSFAQVNQAFGASVALSNDGQTLAVGTPGDKTKAGGINPDGTNYDPSDDALHNSGAVYIFAKAEATWSQQAYLKTTNLVQGYQFGNVVSLSGNGNVLAVGAWFDPSQATGINGDNLDSGAKNAGAAYIFARTGSTWAQKSYVKAPNTNAEDRFGHAIKLDDSGDSLVVGAHRESSNAVGINGDRANNASAAAGAAYLY